MTSFDFGNNAKEEQLSLGLDRSGERFTQVSDSMIMEIVRHYQKEGFPYLELNEKEKEEEFRSLVSFNQQLIFGDSILSDSTAVTLANSYHKHRFEVECNHNRTAMYVFRREHLLKKCVQKCLKMNGKCTPSALRSMISIFEGVQVASNFPPATAKEIYEHFLPNSGVVWDMSCGWGGRLLAALSTDSVRKYQGTEPSTKTVAGLYAMVSDIRLFLDYNDSPTVIHQQGSEKTLPSNFEEVDLCFTSPPYYDTEKYSDEETQSWKAYQTRWEWMHKFIGGTLKNCLTILKPSGYLVINIADVNSYQDLTKGVLKLADEIGFKLLETKFLELSTMPGKGKRNKSKRCHGERKEPVFVWVKK